MTQAAPNPTQAPAEPTVVAMIPRINIHCFCEEQTTAQAVQATGADRRLSKAHVDVHLGGIAAAVQVYHQQQTPEVLIIETRKSRDEFMAELGALAEVCEPTTKVIIIGQVNDVILYRDLIRAGISEYLVAPVQPVQLIETLSGLFDDPEAEPLGRVIAVVGSKGGVGSSTIAHNLGWYISNRLNADTVIADLDIAHGTAGLNFNSEGMQGMAEALSAPDRIDQVLIDRLLTKCTDKLSLLLAPGTIDREVKMEKDALEKVFDVVRKSMPFLIADVPNIWAPWSKHALVHADEIVIVATPELASLRNTKNLVDTLKASRTNDKPPELILNQVDVPKRPEVPVAEFAKAVGIQPTSVIKYDGHLFGTANSNGQMVFEVSEKAEGSTALANLALKLTGREPEVKKTKFSLPLLDKLQNLGKK